MVEIKPKNLDPEELLAGAQLSKFNHGSSGSKLIPSSPGRMMASKKKLDMSTSNPSFTVSGK